MQGGPPVYDDGRLIVDLARRIVRVNSADPKLTPREYALLHELVLHAGKVLTHRYLLGKAWDSGDADVQALRVHIRHLRQKVEDDARAPVSGGEHRRGGGEAGGEQHPAEALRRYRQLLLLDPQAAAEAAGLPGAVEPVAAPPAPPGDTMATVTCDEF